MALGLADTPINTFAMTNLAMPSVIAATTWLACPFFFVFFLAGLKTIPEEINDAVEIDGASPFQKFRYVTIPYLKNVFVITTTLMFIWNFNFFDLIWATTRGGPINRTETFPLLAYRMAFWEMDLGYVSALGVIWILILGLFVYIYLRNMKSLRESDI